MRLPTSSSSHHKDPVKRTICVGAWRGMPRAAPSGTSRAALQGEGGAERRFQERLLVVGQRL